MTSQDPQTQEEDNSLAEENSVNPTKSGWYDDLEGSGGLRWYNAETNKWSKSVADSATVVVKSSEDEDTKESTDRVEADEVVSEIVDAGTYSVPVVGQWRTSYVFSALGAVCGFLFALLLTLIFSGIYAAYIGSGPISLPASSMGAFAGAPAGLITYVLMLGYAAIFYPSFFEVRPFIRSAKIISFANLFFGGILFGCLWNWNLTKSRRAQKKIKGVSWGYAIALAILGILAVGWMMLTVDIPKLQYFKQYNANMIESGFGQSATSTEISNDEPYVVSNGGFSAKFPSTPTYESETGESYGYEYKAESWTVETNAGVYSVACTTVPSDFPGLDNTDGINGGLSSTLLNLLSSFDISSDRAQIKYDTFLGYQSAYTAFTYKNYAFMGRAFIKENTLFVIFAGTGAQEQTEAFVSSFRLL